MVRVIICWLICGTLLSQTGRGDSLPLAWQPGHFHQLSEIPLNQLLAEDQAEETLKMPYRFGWACAFSQNVEWIERPAPLPGFRIREAWFEAKNIYGLGINFKRFELAPGSKIWIGNEFQTLGSFSSEHVPDPAHFASFPVPGNRIGIMLMEPVNAFGKSLIIPESFVQVYRENFWDKSGFGSSGACNIDIKCPEGAGWEDESQAVVMILTVSNQRKCSGILINNTAEDGTPYILTASHCNVAANSLFAFNYISPVCEGSDGDLTKILQGCTVLVNSLASDVTLLRLSQQPPVSWNRFWAGWDRSATPPSQTTTLHHPKGDVMKISHSFAEPLSSGYLPMPDTGNTYWKVQQWHQGTTEAGSSGSPLFNDSRRVIGQLRGGLASCLTSLQDYYGKFSVSWWGSSPSNRLAEWLDPLNTQSTAISGQYHKVPAFPRDMIFTGFSQTDSLYCNRPEIFMQLANHGSDTVHRFSIRLEINGNSTHINDIIPETPMVFGDTIYFELTGYLPETTGHYIIKTEITQINGQDDLYQENNRGELHFSIIQGFAYRLEIQSDAHPEETAWEIRNSYGHLFYAETALTQTLQTAERKICLPAGCYQLSITDAGGDGLCCASGNGKLLLINEQNDTLFHAGTFGYFDSHTFCTGEQTLSDRLNIYPNPADQVFFIRLPEDKNMQDARLTIFNATGQIMHQKALNQKAWTEIRTDTWQSGIYFVDLCLSNGQHFHGKILVLH